MQRVKATLTFPDGLPRAVIDDRIQMLAIPGLTLRQVDAYIESWDTRHIAE